MILIVLAALCVLTVPLTGGKLGRLADLRLRWLWIAPLALALQVLIVNIVPGGNKGLHDAVHLLTYALVGVFLWANRRVPGAVVIASGAFLNALAITLNGGVMPQWSTAARLAGLSAGRGFQNSAALAHAHLLLLGDVIPLPAPFGLNNVLSVGDCLIFAGMVVLLHRTCRTRLGRRRRRRTEPMPVTEIDSMLGSALTSFQAVLALWQAGQSSDSPLGKRALTAFDDCRHAVRLVAENDEALAPASAALRTLGHELGWWVDGAPLEIARERTLMRAERKLTVARGEYLLACCTAKPSRARWSLRRFGRVESNHHSTRRRRSKPSGSPMPSVRVEG